MEEKPLKGIILNFCLEREKKSFEKRKGQLVHVEPIPVTADAKQSVMSEYFAVTLQKKGKGTLCKLIWNVEPIYGIKSFVIRDIKSDNEKDNEKDKDKEKDYDKIIEVVVDEIANFEKPSEAQSAVDEKFNLLDLKPGQLLDVSVKYDFEESIASGLDRICKVGVV